MDPANLRAVYAAIWHDKIETANRYFAAMAVILTVVWGGFGLFATQLDPQANFAVYTTGLASVFAILLCSYWLIYAARLRNGDLLMEDRLREIERLLQISKVFQPGFCERSKPHPFVRALDVPTSVPLGMVVIGFGGIVVWAGLLTVTVLTHFDVI